MPDIVRNAKDIKSLLASYSLSQGYGTTDSDLEDLLFYELEQVHAEAAGSRRWWNIVFKVAKLPFEYSDKGYLLIGFYGAETTGDDSPREAGWVFDWSFIHEVEPKKVTVTIYVKRGA